MAPWTSQDVDHIFVHEAQLKENYNELGEILNNSKRDICSPTPATISAVIVHETFEANEDDTEDEDDSNAPNSR
ncbi:hypothetical protein GN244_ATG09458 [Phytophthora infestans]|uniref:Uncharacterized protein n=1 Tax=Phytophthora infestans TaxID=4787 RepID=A0A833SAY4_PHYIN|nr:hypothetical protein GN244_ATG09458 [Phytophthora infestans]